MNIKGKTKDNAKAREDITHLCHKKELEKDVRTGKQPKAYYTLDKQQKQKYGYVLICKSISFLV